MLRSKLIINVSFGQARETIRQPAFRNLTRILSALLALVEIAVQNRRMQMVMTREAEREVTEGGTVPIGDQRPPLW